MKAEFRQREKFRLVIDTNIWISGSLSRSGVPGQLIHLVIQIGRPIFSPETFTELETRLWRPKFDRYLNAERRRGILHDLSAAAEWVEIPLHLSTKTYCRDPDDDKFIQTALAAQVPWLVSSDRDLLEAPALPELRILTAVDALASLRVLT